jgi:uncharacterized protein YciI
VKHFLIDTTYTVPLPEVEAATPDHRAFLQTVYDNGTLLYSGPKVPRTGGVLMARAVSLEALQAAMAADPFVARKMVECRYVEFNPVRSQPFLKEWLS